ncbi:MAG: hypothetical protein WAL45_06960, partial [Terracidiphilus sp.]
MIGRALGVGVRIAGHIVGQFLAPSAQSAVTPQMHQSVPVGSAQQNRAGQTAARATNQAAQSVGQAGRSV